MKRVVLALGPLLAALLAASLEDGAPDAKAAPLHNRVTNGATIWVQPSKKGVSGSTNRFLLLPRARTPLASKALRPGTYASLPFTAIVIVPGPGPDDKCAARVPDNVDPNMPILRPELQFIPRQPNK